MKLIILKDNLREGLAIIERGVSENNNLPVLKNVLLKTKNGEFEVSATNLEIGITKTIPCKISEEGAIAVPFSSFYNIINHSDSDRINLETSKAVLVVKTDNYEAKLQCISPEEFPIIPKIEDENHFIEIGAETLTSAINDVGSAAQLSEIRPEISGILLDFQINAIKLVATDSFRLAEKTLSNNHFKTNYIKGFRVIIPLKTAQEIARIFSADQLVKLYIDPSQILAASEDRRIISRLIDGEYPDYEQIVPKKNETELILQRENFTRAVKLVAGLAGRTNTIKCRLAENEKALHLYSANELIGENTYLIPAKLTGATFNEITFNWRYLLDGLKAVKSEKFVLSLNGEERPSVLKAEGDAFYFYLIMPVKNT